MRRILQHGFCFSASFVCAWSLLLGREADTATVCFAVEKVIYSSAECGFFLRRWQEKIAKMPEIKLKHVVSCSSEDRVSLSTTTTKTEWNCIVYYLQCWCNDRIIVFFFFFCLIICRHPVDDSDSELGVLHGFPGIWWPGGGAGEGTVWRWVDCGGDRVVAGSGEGGGGGG